jgi:hypothetical protein
MAAEGGERGGHMADMIELKECVRRVSTVGKEMRTSLGEKGKKL